MINLDILSLFIVKIKINIQLHNNTSKVEKKKRRNTNGPHKPQPKFGFFEISFFIFSIRNILVQD